MQLIQYLKDRNESVSAFAARISEPQTTIRKIVYGQRQPSLPLAVKISEATEGATSPGELVINSSDAA
ncbi:hypothetical protein V474_22800 [Novosphingobium barchaimii LL02]|uniref:HTH cro/C1-type domain-containing protein n=1 Tax=Novosphingobium barchaimii LL02 TaxID=1114963 RepID=A0A0J7XPL0_9SPHN|nr:hypothetical protein V474_22800 [Novosphingobium barchaimii LL02]